MESHPLTGALTQRHARLVSGLEVHILAEDDLVDDHARHSR
jgi:hypothetical protein